MWILLAFLPHVVVENRNASVFSHFDKMIMLFFNDCEVKFFF